MTASPPISRLAEDQPHPPRLDGSIHDDREPAPVLPAHLYLANGIKVGPLVTRDRLGDVGIVVLDLGGATIHLHSEEQAQALIDAASSAAAIFASAKMRGKVVNPAGKLEQLPAVTHHG